MNTQVKFEEAKATAFTTLKEYDARVRLNQRRIKSLIERLEANPLDASAAQELELAKAAHKFVLASRAAFKAQSFADRHPPTGLKLRPEQEQALEEGLKRHFAGDPGAGDTHVSELAQGVDPGTEPVIFEGKENHIGITRVDRKPTAAEPQAPVPVDHSREFIPRARVIRERAHAGVMLHRPKYAADDSRHFGLGYKNVHRKGEQWRRTVALAVTPKFPSERGFMLRACKGGQSIMVNGRPWP